MKEVELRNNEASACSLGPWPQWLSRKPPETPVATGKTAHVTPPSGRSGPLTTGNLAAAVMVGPVTIVPRVTAVVSYVPDNPRCGEGAS